MQRLCPRCRNSVTFEDSSSLVFCGHCGAPQIRLSEELLSQAEAGQEATSEAFPVPLKYDTNSTVDWQGAVRCAALAGAIALLLSAVAIKLEPVSLLALFWAVSAPIVTLGIYAGRFRSTRILPGFGARLGILTGIAVTLGMATVNTVQVLVERFVFHSAAHVDAQMNQLFAQFETNSLQQSGAAAQPILSLLQIPEFRAGFLLASLAFFIAMYLVFSAIGGAFAGYLRAKSAAAQA